MNNTIYENDTYLVYRFDTKWNRLFINGIDEMYFKKKIRFLLNYLFHGELFYIKDKAKDKEIGYCMVSKGKAFRYSSFATSNDITIGPIFLEPEYRGKRLSVLLLNQVINCYSKSECAYAYIRRTNYTSIALFSGAGFIPICGARTGKVTRRVFCSSESDTEYQLFRLRVVDRD